MYIKGHDLVREETKEMAMEKSVPHVLLFPFPAQGHLLPTMKLADLLSHAGLYVTFLATEKVHDRCYGHTPGRGPRFRFRTLPDGLPKDAPRPFIDTLDDLLEFVTRASDPYREILADSGGSWPPVTAVIADGIIPFAFEVAEEMGIPAMIFRTSSACSVWTYYCVPELIRRGELASPDAEDMDAIVHGVAGAESFLRRRDLPGFVRMAKSSTDPAVQLFNSCSANLTRARALILNTFESLDVPVLSQISAVCRVVYSLGPLHVLSKNIANAESTTAVSDSGKLWKEDRACMEWLDRQPHESVVYVSFGSITVVSKEELIEFWHGLVNSGKRFLWVVRPDMVKDVAAVADGVVPSELEEGTRERGCLVGWAPQEEVLAHPSVGCFLTHSGWNSTLESIVAGVPMICWPFIGDQHTNSRFVSEVWKIGLDMKDTGGRDVVERMVREVMDGERAVELRRSTRKKAEEARVGAQEGGSSYIDYQKLIQHIKSLAATTHK